MAWNEPGGNNQDPWGGNRKNDGPPDLDEALKKFQERINGIFGGGSGSGGNAGGGFSASAMIFGLVLLVIVYAGFGVYQVTEQERGVVLRLGVFNTIVGPGLHWNPPLIDKVYKENTTRYRFYSSKDEMITEDLNIVEVELSVQYVINDIEKFVLAVKDPEASLKHAADSAVRHVVGSSEMDEVLTEGRAAVADEVRVRLQNYLDRYQTGISLAQLNVERTAPPSEVQAAFDDVNKAREDEERYRNEAEAYANGIVPEARGQAQRVFEEAAAYKEQVIAKAEGEAERFEALLTEYKKAPKVTRERLYLDAMEEVLANTSKVMVDVEGGNNMMYLPLDKLGQGSGVSRASGSSRVNVNLNDQDTREIANQVIEQLRRESSNNRTRR